MENSFWDKAEKCKHKNLYDYSERVRCETPYCDGSEEHCKDCRVYISSCRCGYNDGLSGWPAKRFK